MHAELMSVRTKNCLASAICFCPKIQQRTTPIYLCSGTYRRPRYYHIPIMAPSFDTLSEQDLHEEEEEEIDFSGECKISRLCAPL